MIEAIEAGKTIKGVYHFANQGETTWFDFAKRIQSVAGLTCEVNPIKTVDFPTPAKRPAYSVLDTSRIEKEIGLQIPHWETALQACYDQIMKAS
jgi:dTDP-4-dehydrorhamnose reductase